MTFSVPVRGSRETAPADTQKSGHSPELRAELRAPVRSASSSPCIFCRFPHTGRFYRRVLLRLQHSTRSWRLAATPRFSSSFVLSAPGGARPRISRSFAELGISHRLSRAPARARRGRAGPAAQRAVGVRCRGRGHQGRVGPRPARDQPALRRGDGGGGPPHPVQARRQGDRRPAAALDHVHGQARDRRRRIELSHSLQPWDAAGEQNRFADDGVGGPCPT